MDRLFESIKTEFEAYGKVGLQTFLYVYCMGHGCVDKKRIMMILNGTSSNLYPIELKLREITLATEHATVFAIYDLSKHDRKERYPGLTLASAYH